MSCPFCHNPRTSVLKTSHAADGTVVRRRYCGKCRGRWTTYEYTEVRARKMQRCEKIVDTLAVEIAKSPAEPAWQPEFSDLR